MHRWLLVSLLLSGCGFEANNSELKAIQPTTIQITRINVDQVLNFLNAGTVLQFAQEANIPVLARAFGHLFDAKDFVLVYGPCAVGKTYALQMANRSYQRFQLFFDVTGNAWQFGDEGLYDLLSAVTIENDGLSIENIDKLALVPDWEQKLTAIAQTLFGKAGSVPIFVEFNPQQGNSVAESLLVNIVAARNSGSKKIVTIDFGDGWGPISVQKRFPSKVLDEFRSRSVP